MKTNNVLNSTGLLNRGISNSSLPNQYIIDDLVVSGSGCDMVFSSNEDAERYIALNFTLDERKNLVIVPYEN